MANVNRSEWIDDDGSRLVGTPINNEELQKVYDNIDDEVASPNKPDIQTHSIIDNVVAGIPFPFGGDSSAWTDRATYATGAGYDPDLIIAPGSTVWKVDPALLVGVLKLEAILRTNDPTKAASLALVNMSDAPNVPLVEITTNLVAGALLRSAAIVWPAAGVEKEFAVKLKTEAGGMANAFGIRVFREN